MRVGIPVQDYESIHVEVMMSATEVNTHRQTDGLTALDYAISSEKLKITRVSDSLKPVRRCTMP